MTLNIIAVFFLLLGFAVIQDPTLPEPGKWWFAAGFLFVAYAIAGLKIIDAMCSHEVRKLFRGL
jgi:hypothetical protein